MTDLTDRMRTLAAYIMGQPRDNLRKPAEELFDNAVQLLDEAAALLIEASNLLEAAPAPQGEPLAVLPTLAEQYRAETEDIKRLTGTWVAPGDTLPAANPYRSRNTCPKCDSRASKKVYRQGKDLVLECPVCGHAWKRT